MTATVQDTILVIDDNPTNLGVLFDCLEGAGFKVRVATNGSAALASIYHAPPDLVLLDVMMPGIDGFEVCRRLKAQDNTYDIPVIFMTALSETVDEVSAFQLGAVDYITKPIQVEAVLARVNNHLALRRAQKALQERNAELDAYARMVAHDLKNPLSAVTTSINYLLAHLDDVEKRDLEEYLKIVQGAVNRSVTIVDELLLLAQVRRDTVEVHTLDMATIIGRVCEQLSPMIQSYEATLSLPDTWPEACGYTSWIEVVWINYLSNGLKYGGQPPTLQLGATNQDDGIICFWVQDNGTGLTNAEQQLLFTEFTRLHKNQARGHGIGLTVVRRIIEKLGGQVGVESVVGQGSRFFFTLPAA